QSENSSSLPSDLVDNRTDGLTKNDLSNALPLSWDALETVSQQGNGSFIGRRSLVLLAAVATPPVQQPPAATPFTSVPQSPIGVAAPAPVATSNMTNPMPVISSAAPVKSPSGTLAVPVQMIALESG